MSDDSIIAALTAQLLFSMDRLEWERIRAALANEIEVDYTALFGGTSERLTADALIQRWQRVLPGFDATQHFCSAVAVARDGAHAIAETHVRAYHHIADAAPSVWMIAGHYTLQAEHTAVGWRISGIRLEVFYQEGDAGFARSAADRVKQGRERKVGGVRT